MGEATTTTLAVGGMTCTGCAGNVQRALEAVEGVASAAVDHVAGSANIAHSGVAQGALEAAVTSAGYSVGETTGASGLHQLSSPPTGTATAAAGFDWSDGDTWWQSAHNTKWCLIGCSIGDFGTIAFFQIYLPDAGWTTMSVMLLAMFNGLMTSIALETFILTKQMALKEAFRTAYGMSLISMLSMEAAMNIVDVLITGGAMLAWYTIPPMLIVGFLTPWPYNYWRLKKYGQACH